MADSTVVYTPENNGGGLFGNGSGSAFWGALLGSIIPGAFGGWGGGFGYGGGGAAAASLGAQADRNNNTDLIMNAITGTDSDIRLLASTLNGDVDSLRLGINTVQGSIATVAAQLGLTGQQVINAINSGNAEVASKLAQCCCENKLLVTTQGYENQIATLNQTNALSGAITSGNQKIVDAIADLKTTTISEFCAARERDMQSKIDTQSDLITQLRNQISNDKQSEAFNAAFNVLDSKITALAAKQPQTVPVQWPSLTAVNTTPYMNSGLFGAYGFGGSLTF